MLEPQRHFPTFVLFYPFLRMLEIIQMNFALDSLYTGNFTFKNHTHHHLLCLLWLMMLIFRIVYLLNDIFYFFILFQHISYFIKNYFSPEHNWCILRLYQKHIPNVIFFFFFIIFIQFFPHFTYRYKVWLIKCII